MMALLKMAFATVTGGWQKWAAIGAVALTVAGYIGWLKWDIADYRAAAAEQTAKIDTLTGQLGTAQGVNEENVRQLAAIQEHAKKTAAALAAVNGKLTAARDRAIAIEREIRDVPQSQNCTVGPDVRSVIERLWGQPPAAPVH